ncbi:MAG: VaFE repeat-containing surface-anchored protein [Emergencia sp.]
MKSGMANLLKRIGSVFLITALIITMMPFTSFTEEAYAATKGTFHYGSVVKDANGKAYHWAKSMWGPAYWWDANGNRIKDTAATYESEDAGMERYTIKTDSGTIVGYCIAHGIRVDTTTRLSAKQSLESWAHTDAYPESSKKGIELALAYGWQDGRGITTLINNGFGDSKWYKKHASEYSQGDYYIATQIIIWEYQQLIRTDSIDGGHGRQSNGLVEANHYYNVIKGRAAQDIYDYMIDCIRKHTKPASFAWKIKKDCQDKSKGYVMQDNGDGTYSVILTDKNNIGVDLAPGGKSKSNWTVTRNGSQYTFTYKGELSETGEVFEFTKKIPLIEKYNGGDMLIWSWSSSGSLRQAIATGMSEDPVPMYIMFRTKTSDGGGGGDEEGSPRPEPEFWPSFSFPVDKEDLNPGWDGDTHTGMGDASLAATCTLYRSLNGGDWEEVDSVTLDEYGSQEILSDQPWLSVSDLNEKESGSYTHTEANDDGTTTTHCTVEPTKVEWTANVRYKVVETRPDGRFISPDTGIRDTCEADYYAVTNNSQTCTDDPENWSDIEYTLTYSDDSGTNEAPSGTLGSGGIEENGDYSFSEETFINDCDRGRLFISKSSESEDVFNEEGSSGAQNKSTNSKWKIYLESGGWEDHPYISFTDMGLSDEGTHYYKVVRDTSGTDNATQDLTVGTNGCIYVYDIPYGTYIVEEVKADDESFVLESFKQFIGENTAEHNGAMSGGDTEKYSPNDSRNYDNRYDWNLRDKKKENVIKVVKTDAETGKQVDLTGTRFYIRYMGNQLLDDPTKSENYGRLLPNANDINSTSKDYTFTCNSNGEIVLPYDLEFGTYRIEEFLLPDGYFVGTCDQNGNPSNADYGESGEYGKNDDGKADASMSWETVTDADPSNDLVAVYDQDGNHVDYKAGDIFNFYTFKVENQEGHMDGEDYIKYYKAVAMPNNPVKGKIEIEKTAEVLAGFEKTEKNGFTVWTPKYVYEKLKDAVFGVYAAIDEWLSDGNDGSEIFDTDTGKAITIPTETSTHSGVNGEDAIYDEGTLEHESGAKLYFRKEREVSTDDHYTRIYTTPEQRPTSYSYQIERTEDGLKYLYDVEVNMTCNAGGSNFTDIKVTKITTAADGYQVSIPTTDATSIVGGTAYSPAVNVTDADGNVFDINKETRVYEVNGEKVYDADGTLLYDLADIGVKRYNVKDYEFYKLTAADIAAEERVVEEGVDLNGDGKYTGEGERAPVKETKTVFEWNNDVTLTAPAADGRAVRAEADGTCKVLTENYGWVACDETGEPEPQYTVPEGWMEVPYIPQFDIDEGIITLLNPHYAIITKTEDGVTSYKVLLEDGKTWQDCTADGNFQKMVVDEYESSYTQVAGSDSGFTFELDGITISSQAVEADRTAVTVIESPFDVTPDIQMGIGYAQETEGNRTTFTATEPYAPLYFMSKDGIRTEMYLYGNYTRTLLTIPMAAVEGNYETVSPKIVFTRTGEVIDWFSSLTPDTPVFIREAAYGSSVTATRHEGGKDSDVYYTVEIISDQTMNEGDGPFEITYADGYTAKIYKSKSEAGNDIGVLVFDGVYKTSTAALSDLVDTITTGEDGMATTRELPLGTYIIRELSAPENYVADTEKSWTVELKYKDQYTPLVWEKIYSTNEYVKVQLDLSKVFETGYNTDQYVSGGGAVFGIYNAAPIQYGESELAADTLIDTLVVGSDGRALSETKLPAGVYYLRELKTRDGYLLNDTPFYFVAGDSVKSEPLDISRDPDGQDADGLTVKAVMDGCGKARITIETLNRKPAAEMTVNGTKYVLDTEASDRNVTVKVQDDMSRTTVTVTEDSPAEITLANGKVLKLAVRGNTYTYIYDGVEGTYVPTITNTGYYAGYTLAEQQTDRNAPVEKEMTLTAAAGTSAVTVNTVHAPVMIRNPENPEDPADLIQKTDAEGNKVFDFYADVRLSAGTLISAVLDKEEQNLVEPGTDPIRMAPGTTLKLTADDSSVYLLSADKDWNISISIADTIAAAVTDENAPALTVDGLAVTEGFALYKSITTARQDSSAKTVQVKVNTLDNLNSGDIRNEADEKPSVPTTPGTPVTPGRPSIRTTAVDSDTKDHIANADGKVTIIDTVSCSELTPGREYTLKGILMDQDTGKELLIDGKAVTAEKVFTPEKASETVEMEFTFDGSSLAGKTTVVFEELYLNIDTDNDGKADTPEDKPTAEHKDITDEGQSVHFREPEKQDTSDEIIKKPEVPEEPEKPEVTDLSVPETGDRSQRIFFPVLLLSILLLSLLLAKRRTRQ